MLNNQEFYEYVKEHILEYMTDGYNKNVVIKSLTKNNQVVLHGLTLESEEVCTPILYLEPFYELYQDGADVGELLCRIGHIYEEQLQVERMGLPIECYESYDKARERIFFRVVNYEKNKDMLKDCPVERFHDLAITYRILMSRDECGITSALIRNADLERWNLPKEVLMTEGRKNTRKLFPEMIKPMKQLLFESYGIEVDAPNELYVASNKTKMNGASVMLYEDLLYEFSMKLGENLFVIPSSIHEVLLLRESDALGKEEIEAIIKETNDSVVDEEEILSDTLYYYNREDDTISIYK